MQCNNQSSDAADRSYSKGAPAHIMSSSSRRRSGPQESARSSVVPQLSLDTHAKALNSGGCASHHCNGAKVFLVEISNSSTTQEQRK